MSSNRTQLAALLQSKVITGGNQTSAQNLRDLFTELITSILVIIDDKDANGGYLGINAQGIVDVTKIKQLVSAGKFLMDDGSWQTIASATDDIHEEEITGTDITLPQTPIFIYGVFKNGLRLRESDEYSISGADITLATAASADKFSIVFKY